MAVDAGAIAAGIGNRERFVDAPPSADMDYDLPGARACIIWAYPIPIEVLKHLEKNLRQNACLQSPEKMHVDEGGKEYIKKIDETGKELVYYPAS
ncbi:MAG: hypothetical protein Q6373_013230 [Candidatus Sigynarchaeota archaeon]